MSSLLFSTFHKLLTPLGVVVRTRPGPPIGGGENWDFDFPFVPVGSMTAPGQRMEEPRRIGVRSFFGSTMQGAIRKARAALGPDAVILQTKATDQALRSEGAYEIVCEVRLGAAEPRLQHESPSSMRHTAALDTEVWSPNGMEVVLAQLRTEVAELRKRIAEQEQKLDPAHSSQPQAPRIDSPFLQQLCASGISLTGAKAILEATMKRAGKDNRGGAAISRRDLEEGLTALLAQPYLAQDPGAGQRIQILVGGKRSGKTTAAIKLANHLYEQRAGGVRLFHLTNSGDACGHLEDLAWACRTPREILNDVAALSRLLRQTNPKELIVLDAPCYEPTSLHGAMAFGRMLRDLAGHTVHLVIPAEISSSDLRSSLEFFESFSPGKMLISHLDRPSSVGRVLEEVLSSQKPVSFVAAGSSPAGLLRAANPGLLSRLLLDAQDGLQEEAVENHEWSLK